MSTFAEQVQKLCFINNPYNQTIVIVDKSDKWDKRKANKIKKVILEIKDRMNVGDRLTIKTIEPDDSKESIIKTYFDYCNPGSKANPLYQNPKKILKRYEDSFEKPLKDITNTLLSPTISNNSPILDVLSESLRQSKGKQVFIYLISDTLENDIFDFYEKIPSIDKVFEEIYFPKNKLKLLHIYYIQRDYLKNKTNDSLVLFEKITNTLGAKFEKRRLFTIKYYNKK